MLIKVWLTKQCWNTNHQTCIVNRLVFLSILVLNFFNNLIRLRKQLTKGGILSEWQHRFAIFRQVDGCAGNEVVDVEVQLVIVVVVHQVS